MIFHPTVEPPYYVCIFSSQHATTTSPPHQNLQGYAELADEIHRLARRQSGYLGIDSTRNSATDGFGITVSYWATGEALRAWKRQADHLGAQRLGRERFYADYHVHIARVEREYGMVKNNCNNAAGHNSSDASFSHEESAADSRTGEKD